MNTNPLFLLIPRLVLFVVFNAVSLLSLAENYQWELAKEDKERGIRIFTSQVAGSNLDAFKGEMIVEDKLWRLLALLNDTQKAPKWVENCKSMQLVKKINDKESIFYTINHAPWPLLDRDLVSRVKTSVDPTTHVVTLYISAVDGMVDTKEKLVRIPMLTGFWRFIPKPEGKIKVVYQVHADPGGDIPSWVANAVAVDNPFNTLKNMLKMLKNGDFEQTPPAGVSTQAPKQLEEN